MSHHNEADAETHQRSSWNVGSLCMIYSRSKSNWVEAEITGIEGTGKDEWLMVKYGDANSAKKRKKIQRNCIDIKANNAYSYQLGSKCKIYSEMSSTWCDGEVIDIFHDSEGEWLKIKYSTKCNNNSAFMVCDIQRYSKQMKLVHCDESGDEKADIMPDTNEIPIALTDEYTQFKLIQKTQYNHNCIIFRFALQTKQTRLGLRTGNHLRIKYEDDSGALPISRAYTPISDDSDLGYFDLLIKIYPDGEMSQYLSKIKVNEFVAFEGPLGMICYEKANYLKIKKFDFDTMRDVEHYLNVTKIGMLAGGTGINPIYQIIKHIDKNKKTDNTKISLIFSNKTENDILLKEELNAINQENENINIFHTVSNLNGVEKNWKGGIGRINIEMIKKNIFAPNDDVGVVLCGSREFNRSMKELCQQIGYKQSNVLAF